MIIVVILASNRVGLSKQVLRLTLRRRLQYHHPYALNHPT